MVVFGFVHALAFLTRQVIAWLRFTTPLWHITPDLRLQNAGVFLSGVFFAPLEISGYYVPLHIDGQKKSRIPEDTCNLDNA
ncbi:MAG: hypothetical protein HQK89_02295 [Nitrospirae bacterium]|nr:hypothetical protein [Nitrospirota bacterium]